ncbi:hypothetical protein [Rossellomorea aquimaris]|uniref:DUF4129 domain-containing protein n=1 Tax=Rossellomorea aquimaris TaxID=189382 RepID=A0A366EXA0_9BACI|nr:hypothetical protein [Rossellomorea aquimaris]RBP07032.1 hypothetical protein DET59_102420 [Rossellomorea aquimaris]
MESFIENSFLAKHKKMLFIKMGLYAGIDLLFVLLAMTFLFTGNLVLNQYVPAFAVLLILILTYTAISFKVQSFNPLLLFAMFALGVGMGILLFSASWWVLIPAAIFLHWRISSYLQIKDPSIEVSSGNVLIFLFISAASLFSGSIRQLENTYLVYSLLFLLFAFIGTFTSFQRMLASDSTGVKKSIYKPFALLLIVFVSGGILAAASSVVSQGVYWLLEKVFWLFSFLVNPIFSILIELRDSIMKFFESNPEKGDGNKIEQQTYDESQLGTLGDGLSFSWVDEALLALLVFFAIIYLFKKRKTTLHLSLNEGTTPVMMTRAGGEADTHNQKEQIEYSKARDAIRKSMEMLEKEAYKNEVGRLPNENVQAWFARIDLEENAQFFTIYERVRYGRGVPEQDEVDLFTKRIREHIESLNTRHE